MKNIKTLFTKCLYKTLLLVILGSSTSFANIDNQTSLSILHGNSNSPYLQKEELQTLENYKPNSMHIKTSNTSNKHLLKLDKFLSQITKNCKNNYIIAHSIGGIILFEYLKSITKNA
jgi:predicted alpha/beta hydrolase family esterase